jgi:acyl-CoA synthetase (AMP-forming)/AMP-acid ligase II
VTAELTTLPALLARQAAERGSQAMLVHDDEVLTYAALDDRSRARAAELVAAGAAKGDRVGILLPNGIDWVVEALAVARIGAVLVPLSTLLRPPELEAQLRTAAVAHLIGGPPFRGRDHLAELEPLRPGLPTLRHVWRVDDPPGPRAPEAIVDALGAAARPGDDLVVLFTSGSRGAPKGTIHTHAGALRATASGLEARRIGAGDRLYIPMPFFWTGGFAGGLLSVLIAGATLLSESDPTPAGTITFLQAQRATLFRGWPDQAARIAADPAFASADLSLLKPGSLDAVLPPALRAAPGARANLFGMTETFGPYCGSRLDLDLPPSAHGSCGKPFEGTEARIVDDEVQVRGPNIMRGICGRFRSTVFTADGWYPTGDLGELDADGYLSYRGRTDDMVKVSGATVYPTEVEAALRALAAVRLAHVTDVPGTDGAPVIAAAVLLADGFTLEDVERILRATLSSFKVPRRWLALASADEVPMLASGKVDKNALQALLA